MLRTLFLVFLGYSSLKADDLIENAGFPCSIRDSIRLPRILHGPPRVTKPPFEMTVLDQNGKPVSEYERGVIYTVRLVGYVHFRGFLLQPRLCTPTGQMIGSLRGGEFIQRPNWKDYGFDYQDCNIFASNDSLTHVNDEKKFLIEAQWIADRNLGAVQFIATIASENGMFWERWRPQTAFIHPKGSKTQMVDQTVFGVYKEENQSNETQDSEVFGGLPFDSSLFETLDVMGGPTSNENQKLEVMTEDSDIVVTRSTELPQSTTAATVKVSEEAAITQMTSRMFRNFQPESGLSRDDLKFLNAHSHLTHKDFIGGEMDPEEFCAQSNPCENDGICSIEKKRIKCKCSEGWTGDRCAEKDRCFSNSCSKNKTNKCVNDENGIGYKCMCKNGFVGTYCDFECPSNLCQNRGQCIQKSNMKFGCECLPGTAGSHCERDINECNFNHCKNSDKCTDLFNDYRCNCKHGWMGKDCDRPCQDVYGSCKIWKREGQCELMRDSTDFFDLNCAASCGKCTFDNSTVITWLPLPPILLPLSWLIGEWQCHVKGFHNKAMDFPFDMLNTTGYTETVTFTVSKALMFGTPSINYTSTAVSDSDPTNVHISHGFLSIRQYPPEGDKALRASIMSVSNVGVQLVEEGDILMTRTTMGSHLHLVPTFRTIQPDVEMRIPDKAYRSFVRKGSRLMQLVTKEIKGRVTKYTKTYTQTKSFSYL